MDKQNEAACWVAQVIEPSARRSLFSFKRSKETLTPPDENTHLYIRSRGADGVQEVRREIPGQGEYIATAVGDQGVYVSLLRWPLSLSYSSVLNDHNGSAWDLQVRGSWVVIESRRFVCSSVMDAASSRVGLSMDFVQSWMVRATASKVQDAVRDHKIEDLRYQDALPATWWETHLSDWLGESGISLYVGEIEYTSAEANAAAAKAARQRDLKRIAEAKQQEREIELTEMATEAEYEKQKNQIKFDLTLSDQERSHQLQLLEKLHRKELIEADTEIENARREAEKAVLEHEATLALLRQDADAVENAEERDRQAEEHHQLVVKELAELKLTLTKLADLPENLLAQLADLDSRKASVAADRIVSPEFGISASLLTGLGFQVGRQNIVECLRERAAADGDRVSIRKTELVTRDIGTVKVRALPINTSLQFEFSTERSGYVTLLNIGTSGSIYIHVPNAYVTMERARVEGGHSYAVPGPELLPWERLRQLGLEYVEVGPPGWEHIAVLVSDSPLLDECSLYETDKDAPFVKLEIDDIASLFERISAAPEDSWSAGVLSFLVG